MLFQTSTFFLFFTAFIAGYALLSKHLRWQNALILLGSYFFYGAWDERFLVLIALSTMVDYLAALGVAGKNISKRQLQIAGGFVVLVSGVAFADSLRESWGYLVAVSVFAIGFVSCVPYLLGLQESLRRKTFMTISVVFNLGLLAIFKYFNFFAGSMAQLFANFGVDVGFNTLSIVLPVGISFYTFQTMSYTIDVFRKKLEPSDRFVEVAAFISFFPQLVAGPIERGKAFLPQFLSPRNVQFEDVRSGALLFLWGLFKKVVVADQLAPLVDPAFSHPDSLTSGALMVGLLAFTFQIYCDFSGYSDMARGIARTMGFKLMLNFNLPYLARTPSEFWQRWHISLSSWLRDYLYIPLGGNRGGNFGTYRNLTLTMLLGGLWHGANWTFIVWGALHGSILVIYRLIKVDEWLAKSSLQGTSKSLRDGALIVVMMLQVMLCWLFFRAETLSSAMTYLTGIFSYGQWIEGDWQRLVGVIWPLLIYQVLQVFYKNLEFLGQANRWVTVNAVLFMVCGVVFLGSSGQTAFIYFDF